MIRVTKKNERLARALSVLNLLEINFPLKKIQEKTNACWPGYLNNAKKLNKIINSIDDYELDLITWQKDIDLYEG